MHIIRIVLILALNSVPLLTLGQQESSKAASEEFPGESSSENLKNGLLDSVTVVGRKKALSTTKSITTLSAEELDKVKGLPLAAMIRSVPGVTMLQTGATIAKPVIHGMHSNRLLILNNGIRQEGQQWGSEHAPEIDPFIATRISVVKGAEAIRFGANAIGGVVIVEPPELPLKSGVHGELNLTGAMNGRSGVISGRLEGGVARLPGMGWRIQGTLNRSGNFRTADYYLENTGVKAFNFSAAAGYSHEKLRTEIYFSRFNTSLGIFRGAHIGNLSDLEARIENGRPRTEGEFSYAIDVPRQHILHHLLKLKGQLRFSDGFRLNLQYGFQHNRRREFDIRRGDRSGIPSMDLALSTQTLDVSLERITAKGWKSTLGMNGLIQVNNTVKGTFATPLIPNFDNYGAGIYFIRKLLKPDYELEAGLRYDYNYLDALGYDRELNFYGGTRTFHHVSASAGGLWRVNNRWNLRSNLGLAWRPPTVNELYSNGLHHGTASYELGNSHLKSEQSYKWISTAEYQGDKLSAKLSIYAHWFNNYIYLNPALDYVTTMQGSFPTFNYEQTNARFGGIDLYGNYLLSKALELEIKGSILRAKDISNGRYLPWIPPDRIRGSLRWNFSLSQGHRNAYLQLQHEYAARQTRYEAESDFAPPPGAFHLWHLQAGAGWERGGHSLSLNLSISNLSNTLYREYMNRFRYYAHDMGRNITLRMTYRF